MQKASAFIPASVTKTLLCIQNTDFYELAGFLFNPYMSDTYSFESVKDLLDQLDRFFDEKGFPQPSFTLRGFSESKNEKPKKRRVLETPKMLRDPGMFDTLRGERATFAICVNQRQNATWQGMIMWLERDLSRNFRSTLELIKFIDSALTSGEQGSPGIIWGDNVTGL